MNAKPKTDGFFDPHVQIDFLPGNQNLSKQLIDQMKTDARKRSSSPQPDQQNEPNTIADMMWEIKEEAINLKKEQRERKKRIKDATKPIKDPLDLKEKQRMFNKKQPNFKNNIERYGDPMYKIQNDVPRNINEGLHKVSFEQVDAKSKATNFLKRE